METLLRQFPLETECYGFIVSDIDLSYKKGMLQATLYYQDKSENMDTMVFRKDPLKKV